MNLETSQPLKSRSRKPLRLVASLLLATLAIPSAGCGKKGAGGFVSGCPENGANVKVIADAPRILSYPAI